MKDSGYKWLGQIPNDWEVVRLKSLFTFGKGLPITKADLISEGSPVISYGQIHSKNNTGVKVDDSLKRFVSKDFLLSNANSLVDEGDFIVADTSEDVEGCGNCVYVDKPQELFAGYHTIIMKAEKQKKNKYFAYLFQTDNWRSQIREKVDGVKLFSTTQTILKQTYVSLPPFSQQQKIADFLDSKCSQIQAAINDTKQTIEEYKKLKQAVITKAVTKGLKENRRMKDSGIEWIGEIPEEWEISRVGKFFEIQLGKMLQPNKEFSDDSYENYLCAANVGKNQLKMDSLKQMWFSKRDKEVFNVCKGDLLVVEGGDVASCAIIKEEVDNLYIQNALHRVRANEGFEIRLLKYLLMVAKATGHIDLICNKATIAHFTKEKFSSLPFPFPPKEEQEKIVDYLDKKCSQIDDLIQQKEQFITELEKYKQSLIYEYVTGKKEVK